MDRWLATLAQTIRREQLFNRGQTIVVAVSGGVDSIVLLHALQALAADWHWSLIVAHFNHHLRGAASDADADFVRSVAQQLQRPFVLGEGDVAALRRQRGWSLEMAARHLRHAFLAETARKHGGAPVALAHHLNDQIELFFLRLLRGTTSLGLAGMRPTSPSPAHPDVRLVRPLLRQPKSALLDYARRHTLVFRQDASNRQRTLPRNRLRHDLIPWLERRFQPALTQIIPRLMDLADAESGFVDQAARRWLAQKRPRDFQNLHPAVQRQVLLIQWLDRGFEPRFTQLEAVRRTAFHPVTLRPGTRVYRNDTGHLLTATAPDPLPVAYQKEQILVRLTGRQGQFRFGALSVSWQHRRVTPGPKGPPPRQAGRECFDAARVGRQLWLRYWQPGDRFQPCGMAQPVRLQDLWTNAKVPVAQRRQAVVAVAEDGRIFWVEGLRISEAFKLSPHTREHLVWQWERAKTIPGSGCPTPPPQP